MLAAIGTNTAVLWVLLPLAVLFAGVAPAVISFAAGQAAFTLTLLILFNIIQPAGWRLGLRAGGGHRDRLRREPRRRAALLAARRPRRAPPRGGHGLRRHRALPGTAPSSSACSAATPARRRPRLPASEAAHAVGRASRRLDDAFRSYLAERGAKPVATGRGDEPGHGRRRRCASTADAVLDLWQRDDHAAEGDRTAARAELLNEQPRASGAGTTSSRPVLLARGEVPAPLEPTRTPTTASSTPCATICSRGTANATATAVRMIWTGDHLDAARRMQALVVGPASAAGVAR